MYFFKFFVIYLQLAVDSSRVHGRYRAMVREAYNVVENIIQG